MQQEMTVSSWHINFATRETPGAETASFILLVSLIPGTKWCPFIFLAPRVQFDAINHYWLLTTGTSKQPVRTASKYVLTWMRE